MFLPALQTQVMAARGIFIPLNALGFLVFVCRMVLLALGERTLSMVILLVFTSVPRMCLPYFLRIV